MSISGPFADGPNQIRYECQQIALQFSKLSDSEGTLTWNIPKSVTGCATPAVYNGAVIVAHTKPILTEHKPMPGVVYVGDPTVDVSLHVGTKIGDAIVIASLYDDVVTSEVFVSGLQPGVPYHFALFGVTAQFEYDRAGAHAYSTAAGKDSHGDSYPAYHEFRVLGPANKKINIKDHKFIRPSTLGEISTNLPLTSSYKASVCINGETLQLEFTGAEAVTWDQLVDTLNLKVALAQNAPHLNNPPNIGGLYVDVRNKQLSRWTGDRYEVLDATFSPHDPSYIPTGTYFMVDGVLKQRNATGWIDIEYSTLANPNQQTSWYDGTVVKTWNGTTWCHHDTYTQPRDPTTSPTLEQGCHWYNTTTGIVSTQRDGCWSPVSVLYYKEDPNALPDGTLWFNDVTNELRVKTAAGWDRIDVKPRRTACKDPIDGSYWLNTSGVVKQYNALAAKWNNVDVLTWSTDPTIQSSCSRWWNATTDTLHVWSADSGDWVLSTCFIQGAVDPLSNTQLPRGTFWNSGSGWLMWDGMDWVPNIVIEQDNDPRIPVVGSIVTDSVGAFFVVESDGSLTPIVVTESDITDVRPGQYWYNPVVDSLNVWIGTSWLTVPHSTTPHVPANGTLYFDIPSSTLLMWSGVGYIPAPLPVTFGITQYNNLAVVTQQTGSAQTVKVTVDPELVKVIKPRLIYLDPVSGDDGISVKPMYKTEGVGTDGSEDERRELANYVMSMLGYPMVQVELTKMQLDLAIDDALEVLRLRTSSAYKRAYVVVDLLPNQQTYLFSNRSAQLDKVVRVMKIHRTKFGRIGAYSYEDTFGHAMVQQLYYAGSFDILSYHLLAQYNEMINMVFANDITFSWSESDRLLMVQQTIRNKERVLAEVELEKTEQELIRDRVLRNWIKKYTLGKSMLILAQPRGKFASLAGAGGGISLNAADLQTQGQALIDECNMDIDNGIIGSMDQYGSSLVMMG